MIEVQYVCQRCKQQFIRVAVAETDIRVLQATIWVIQVCEFCRSYDDRKGE